jgi:hypothetical protein
MTVSSRTAARAQPGRGRQRTEARDLHRRVASHQAKQAEEMQAVADALSLLANLVMAWSTAQMQQVLNHWGYDAASTLGPKELIGRIAPAEPRG